MVKAVDIEFDVNDVSHQFAGFGAQIWPGDTRVESLIASLNMEYVRMKFGGNWNPPTDATQAEMDAYVASQYDSNTSIRNTYAILMQHDVAVIGNYFEGPSGWLGTNNTLKSENFDDFVRLWGSIAYYMQNNSMPIRYIEMFNEPEGDWNIKVPGASYNTIVKLMRSELDSRGLTNVGIVGPGLAYLYHGPDWISALDNDGKAALECWSTHAWDEGWAHQDALPSFLDQRWQDYFGAAVDSADPSHSKPIIVTEYATGVRTYNGVTFGDEVTDTSQFAQRCYENTLTLVNNGANVLCYWEAANQSWQNGQNEPMSGLMRTNSTLRPVYYAFSTLMPFIPDNAMVLRKTWNDPNISTAGFAGDNQLVLAFANSTADTVTRTVGVTGVSSFIITSARAFESGAIVDKLSQVSFDYDSNSMSISLAPESTLTIAAVVNECTVNRLGDLSGDCWTTLADFSIVGANWLRDDRIFTEQSTADDFESYATSPELQSAWSDRTANVTVSVNTTTVRSGNQSMKYEFNNGNDPWWSKAGYFLPGVVWNTSGVDWSGYSTLSAWYNVQSNGGDDLKIKVVNCWGTELYTENFGNVPAGGGWQEAVIDLAAHLTPTQLQHVGRVDIMMLAGSSASGVLYFDDIVVHNNDSICSGSTPGDVTSDCVVNLSDIKVLAENWLTCVLIE
jgi:hypothetical protein